MFDGPELMDLGYDTVAATSSLSHQSEHFEALSRIRSRGITYEKGRSMVWSTMSHGQEKFRGTLSPKCSLKPEMAGYPNPENVKGCTVW